MRVEQYRQLVAAEKPAKRPKYGNRQVKTPEQTFDSAKEARRYGDLVLMQRAGLIHDLRTQEAFPLVCNGVRVASYVADFVYIRTEDGATVVEDVKSEITRKNPVYRLKAKMMAAMGRPITEV